MNHIHRLMSERDEARETIRETRNELTDLIRYLSSSKFTAPDCDYVHVRTDMLPKLMALQFKLCGE